MLDTKGILIGARELISDKTNWVRKVYALDNLGREVTPTNENACKWCSYGAIYKIAGGVDYPARHKLRQASSILYGDTPVGVNDYQSHADVIKMFDKAIELARKEN